MQLNVSLHWQNSRAPQPNHDGVRFQKRLFIAGFADLLEEISQGVVRFN